MWLSLHVYQKLFMRTVFVNSMQGQRDSRKPWDGSFCKRALSSFHTHIDNETYCGWWYAALLVVIFSPYTGWHSSPLQVPSLYFTIPSCVHLFSVIGDSITFITLHFFPFAVGPICFINLNIYGTFLNKIVHNNDFFPSMFLQVWCNWHSAFLT